MLNFRESRRGFLRNLVECTYWVSIFGDQENPDVYRLYRNFFIRMIFFEPELDFLDPRSDQGRVKR